MGKKRSKRLSKKEPVRSRKTTKRETASKITRKKSAKKTRKSSKPYKPLTGFLEQDSYERPEAESGTKSGDRKRSVRGSSGLREKKTGGKRAAGKSGKDEPRGKTSHGTRAKKSVKKPSKKKEPRSEEIPESKRPSKSRPLGRDRRGKTDERGERPLGRDGDARRASRSRDAEAETLSQRRARKQAQRPTRTPKDRPYKIVALNPRTGQIVARPKSGQEILFGIQDEKGHVSRIETRFTQQYAKVDHAGLQKIIDRTGKKDFVVYEQLTRRKFRDPETGFIRQAEKITFGKQEAGQRPVLYSNGRRVRELDLGFRERTKREMVDDMLMTVLKPDGKFTRDILLEGDTIKDTLKNLPLKLTMAQIKKYELEGIFYEIVLKIKGEEPIIVYGKTETYANMATDIARDIRFHLANRGMRFTSLLTLEELAGEAQSAGDDEMESKILRVGRHRTPVASLNPIFEENEFGHDAERRAGSGKVTMDIKISGAG